MEVAVKLKSYFKNGKKQKFFYEGGIWYTKYTSVNMFYKEQFR
jgi:hypothetical protein